MMCVGDVDSIGVDSRYDCSPAKRPRPGSVSLQRKFQKAWEITHRSVRHGMRRVERRDLGKIEVRKIRIK